MRRTVALLPLALALGCLTACGSGSAKAGPPPATAGTATGGGGRLVQVVAAENVWGDVTRQIGGAHVQVTSIISDPNADPHTYETNPRNAAAVSRASFVVLNGLGYDDFASKLLAAAGPNPDRTVVHLDAVNHVGGDNPNPHLWYSPAYVKGSADAITAELRRVDPADAAAFDAGERTFLAAYQPYVDTLATIKARHGGTKVSYTERVPGYLVDAAGLVLGTPASFSQAVEDGDDPSPLDTTTFDADVTGHKVAVLLYNRQVTDAQTSDILGLARRAAVPVVGVTETLPPGQDFQGWQLAQARAVLAALGG